MNCVTLKILHVIKMDSVNCVVICSGCVPLLAPMSLWSAHFTHTYSHSVNAPPHFYAVYAHPWFHHLNLHCRLSSANTCRVPSPSSSMERATCAQVWRLPSTSLRTTSQNTTSVLRRPPSHQYRVTPQTRCFFFSSSAYACKTKQSSCSIYIQQRCDYYYVKMEVS